MKLRITALSCSKSYWEEKFSDKLVGAFGEYCKLRFAEELEISHINTFNHWDYETTSLIKKLEDWVFSQKTSSKFKREKVIQEYLAHFDVHGEFKIREMKREFQRDLNDTLKAQVKPFCDRIKFNSFDTNLWVVEMIKRFSPRLNEFLRLKD